MNLKIREFEQSIIQFVNGSDLPMEVKRLAVKEVMTQLEDEATKALREEIAAANAKKREDAE